MKRLQYHEYGGPETMQLDDFDLPAPAAGEVAVKVKFASIQPVDWKLRRGDLKLLTGRKFPRAMGCDFSGVVLAVGSGVTRLKVGDAVFGIARLKESGAFAEAVITSQDFVGVKPAELSFEQAACLATAGVVAWSGLIDRAHLRAGQHVFVNGCTGAIGEAVVQLAKHLRTSVAGSCAVESFARAEELGVAPLIDYRTANLNSISDRFDVVFDTSGQLPVDVGLHLLKKSGLLLDIHFTPAKLVRSLVSRKFKLFNCVPSPQILDGVSAAAAKGPLRMRVGNTVPLVEASRLIGELEAGRKLNGKGLISVQ